MVGYRNVGAELMSSRAVLEKFIKVRGMGNVCGKSKHGRCSLRAFVR